MNLTSIKIGKKARASLAAAVLYSLLTLLFDLILQERLHLEEVNLSIIAQFYPVLPKTSFIPTGPVHTVILELGSGANEPRSSTNLCGFRALVADALEHAFTLDPRGVLVDVEFPTNVTCSGQDGDADGRLRRAGQALLAKAPVYFGAELTAERTGLTPVIFPCTNPTADENGKYCPERYPGGVELLDLPLDRRQLALAYKGYASGREAAYPTLSYRAAYDDQGEELNKLPAIQDGLKGRSLYHFLLEPSSWKPGERFFTWDSFRRLTNEHGESPMRNNWLIIGSKEDLVHTADFSSIEPPGYFHQASVLDALLGRRVLKALGWWWEVLAAFIFWLLVEFLGGTIAKKRHGLRAWSRLLVASGLICFMFVITLVMADFFGYYGDFALVSTLGMAILVLELFNHVLNKLRKAAGEKE